MKKTINKIGIVLLLILISLIIFGIFSLIRAPYVSDGETDYDNNYRFLNYVVDVEVNEDNTYNVTETIQAEFKPLDYGIFGNNSRRGIYRYIPIYNTIYRHDGEKEIEEDYYCRITDVEVGYRINGGAEKSNYFSSTESGFLVLVIGDENELVNGKTVEYSISYKFHAGYDRDKTKDFLYLNILGDGRTTYIDNFAFSVSMPASFDSDLTKFYVGEFGATGGAEKLSVSIDEVNNIITGQYVAGVIPKDEAITIYIELPENYFKVELLMPVGDIIVVSISLLILAITLVLAFGQIGKKQIVNKPVEFFPPDGYNPPEAGFILNGNIAHKKMSSLIIYWASKGYLKIDATDVNNIIITRQVNELPEGSRSYEKTLFEKLFKKSEPFNHNKKLVGTFIEGLVDKTDKTNSDSFEKDEFEEEFPSININNVNADFAMSVVNARNTVKALNGGAPVSASSRVASFAIKAMGLIPFILFSTLYFYRMNLQPIIIIFGLVFAAFQLVATMILSYGYYLNANESGNTAKKRRLYTISIMLLTVWYVFLFSLWFNHAILDPYGLRYIVVVVSFISNICAVAFIKLREEIKNDFGRLEGFRNFIETAEKDRIKVLVNDNPSYFYDILPYAYIFDITNEFSKKFEGLTIPPSSYIATANVYDIVLLNLMFSNINVAITKSAINNIAKSSPRRSGGFGGFGGSFGGGGGGFSGGGFGGGGSGSW